MDKILKVGRKVTAQYVLTNEGENFVVKPAAKLNAQEIDKVMRGLAAYDDFSSRLVLNKVYEKSILVYCLVTKGKFDHVELTRVTIEKFALENKLVVLNLPVADYFLLAPTDVLMEELDALGIGVYFRKLHPIKFYERVKKALGRFEKLPDANVLIGSEYRGIPIEPGLALVSTKYASLAGLKTGDKLSVVLKSTVVVVDDILFDIIITHDEDKLDMGLELGKHLYKSLDHNSHVMNNTGSLTVFNEHTYANFNMYEENPDLTELKEFLSTHKCTDKFLYDVCGYWDKKYEMILLGKVGEKIKKGIFDDQVKRGLDILINKYIRDRVIYLPVYTRGGLALPRRYAPADRRVITGLIMRYPCDVPIENYVLYSDVTECYYVSPKLWEFFGGDYDGDLVHVYLSKRLAFIDKKLPGYKLPKGFYNWERDAKDLLKAFYMPEKKSSMDAMSFSEAWKSVKRTESNIGRAHTNVKACIEVLALDPEESKKRQMYSIWLAGKYIQPAIDSKKYVDAYKPMDIKAFLKTKAGYVDYYKALIRLVVRSLNWSDIVNTRIRVTNPKTYFEKVFLVLEKLSKEVIIK